MRVSWPFCTSSGAESKSWLAEGFSAQLVTTVTSLSIDEAATRSCAPDSQDAHQTRKREVVLANRLYLYHLVCHSDAEAEIYNSLSRLRDGSDAG